MTSKSLSLRLRKAVAEGAITHPEQWPEVHQVAIYKALQYAAPTLAQRYGIPSDRTEDCIHEAWLKILTAPFDFPHPKITRRQFALQCLKKTMRDLRQAIGRERRRLKRFAQRQGAAVDRGFAAAED